jgi:DNA polymerase III epsilon subunit family exonuclease
VALLEANDRLVPLTTIGKEVFRFRHPHIPHLRRILNRLIKDDPRLVVRADDYLELLPDEREFKSLDESDYVVVDVETTGINPQLDRVTEIAAIRVSRNGNGTGRQAIHDEFVTLVDPEREIPPTITMMTGITNTMVARAPRFCDITDELVSFIGNRIIVAHNAYFDTNFLNAEISRAYGQRLANLPLCTLKLGRRLFPELSNHKLYTIAYYLGIEIEKRHRARDDARATAKMFIRMLDMLEDRGILTIFEAKEFHKKRRVPAPTKPRRRIV